MQTVKFFDYIVWIKRDIAHINHHKPHNVSEKFTLTMKLNTIRNNRKQEITDRPYKINQ